MSGKVYNIAFRMGVLFNILLSTTLNLLTFIETQKNFVAMNSSDLGMFPINGWNWGFPYPMFNYPELFIYADYLLINFSICVFSSFFFGFLFKFIWSKISLRRAELK